jgi:hypothetical protein
MKWLDENYTPPHAGNTITKLKFAFLPVDNVKGSDGKRYVVWLDKYHQSYIYKSSINGLSLVELDRWIG